MLKAEQFCETVLHDLSESREGVGRQYLIHEMATVPKDKSDDANSWEDIMLGVGRRPVLIGQTVGLDDQRMGREL